MKFKLKYLIIFCLFFLPIRVNAASVSLNIACPQAASAGQTINCTISTNNSGDLNGISAQYSLSGGASYVNFASSGTYTVTNIKNNGFQLGNGNGLASSQVLGTLSILIPSTAQAGNVFNIGLTEINASTMDYEDISGANVSARVSILSSNADLKSLSITGANINFSAGNTYYEVSIGSYNTTISAQAADGGANVSGAGYKTLKEGKNTFYITVTAPSGAKKTYTVVIKTPVTPKPQQPQQPQPNTGGQNQQPEQQPEEKPQEQKKDSNTNLKKLSLDIAVLAFEKNKTNYEISVDNEVDKVTIEAVAESEKATVEGNGTHDLALGQNVINIVVTAENGYVKTYEIIIVREKPIVISNANKISALKINGVDLKFDPDKNEYELTTEYKSLDLKINLFDDNSSYKITGNSSLITGSEVRIRVTDAEGNINVYKIHVTVPEKQHDIKVITEEKVSYLPVIIISILLVIVIGVSIVYLIIKKRKEDSEEDVYEIVELKPIVEEAPEVLDMETNEIPILEEKRTEEKVTIEQKPVVQPKPITQNIVTQKPVPVAQPRPVTQNVVTQKPVPVAQPRPVTQNVVIQKPVPVAQPKPVTQNIITQKPVPVAQPRPATQNVVTQKPVSTTQQMTQSVNKVQSKPVTQTTQQQPRPVQRPVVQQQVARPVASPTNKVEAVMPVSTPPNIINKK